MSELTPETMKAIAAETLPLPNKEAWQTIHIKLLERGVTRIGSAAQLAWKVRRELQDEAHRQRQEAPKTKRTKTQATPQV
jgi:hypothetical protein